MTRQSASRLFRLLTPYLLLALLLPLFACGDDDDPATPTPTPAAEPRIVFASRRTDNGQIFSMKLDGSDVQQISTEGTAVFGSLSGQGDRVVYSSTRDGQQDLFVADLDGQNEVQLTSRTASDYRPAFSRDGAHIAFVSEVSGNREIWLLDVNTGARTQLTDDPAEDTFPAFDATGQRVLFTSYRDGHAQTYAVGVDGTGLVNLSDGAFADYTPCAAPDSSRILFTRTDGVSDLWVMDPDGSNQQKLLAIDGSEWHASWTPDSQRIVFYSDVSGNQEIYIVGVDGSGLTNLTNNAANDFKTTTWIAP